MSTATGIRFLGSTIRNVISSTDFASVGRNSDHARISTDLAPTSQSHDQQILRYLKRLSLAIGENRFLFGPASPSQDQPEHN